MIGRLRRVKIGDYGCFVFQEVPLLAHDRKCIGARLNKILVMIEIGRLVLLIGISSYRQGWLSLIKWKLRSLRRVVTNQN